MSNSVVVGVDGSDESASAAEWAAREARRRGSTLRVVHVTGTAGGALAPERTTGGRPPEFTVRLRDRLASELPGLELSCEQLPGDASYVLAAAGERGHLLVLGSRGLGGFTGLVTGSVGLRTAAHARCPVVLVRAGAEEVLGETAGDVVVGIDGEQPCDAVIRFAFEEAERRGAVLRAVEGWKAPYGPYLTQGPVSQSEIRDSLAASALLRLQDALGRWQEKFPEVRTEAEVVGRSAAKALVESSHDAGMVVLGRRAPSYPMGAPRLGPVAHAVLQHAHCPVAVIPHA